jgi:hypothetical protein
MTKGFCGYALHRGEQKAVVSLIEMTCGKLGVHKRYFKTEETFWKAIHFVSGLAPLEGEGFSKAVHRIRGTIGQYSTEKRVKMVNAVEPKAFYAAIGMTIHETKGFIERPHVEVVGRKPRQPRAPRLKAKAPAAATKEDFYKSWEWRTLRMEVLKEHGRACQCCGAEPGMKDAAGDPVRICVDHIKPLSKFWHLRLERKNLQVLCDECNQGKGNWDQTDFRPAPAPDEWLTEADSVSPEILAQLTVHGETIQ